MNKIVLVTSPFFDFWNSQPYLSVPLLSGQLVSSGFDVMCYDFASEFLSDVFDDKFIEENYSKLSELQKNLSNFSCDKQVLYKKQFIEQHCETWYKELKRYLKDKNSKNPSSKLIDIAYKFALSPYIYDKKDYSLNYDSLKEHCYNKNTNFFISYLENKIQKIPNDVDLICISALPDFEIYPVLTLSRLLKEKFKTSKIVLGGYWFTSVSDVLMKTPDFFDIFCDYVLTGNGELSIVDLAKNTNINEISGLLYKDSDNIVHKNEDMEFDINSIKYANYDYCDFSKYFSDDNTISMMLSKGCYWGKCKFCSYKSDNKYQIKDIKNVIEEIKYYVDKYKIGSIHFIDDAIPPVYYNNLANEIIKNGIKINFSSFAIFDDGFNFEMFKNLYQSGLRTLIWGLETNSERLFKLINKSGCYEKRSDILKASSKAGLYNIVNIIDGLPEETVEDIIQTVKFLFENRDYIDSLTIQKFQLRVNTEFAKNPQKYNIQVQENKDDFSLYYKYKKNNPINREFALFEHYHNVVKSHPDLLNQKDIFNLFLSEYIEKHQQYFSDIKVN